ncbi:MAG: NAD-dependent epimerase/dehydratase family protein [Solibacillus sp.]
MKNKTVLVTGATGYIGGNLVEKLISEDYTVHLIVRPNSHVDKLKKKFSNINLHVYDGSVDSLIQIFKGKGINTVFHLAASCVTEHKPKDISVLIESNILFGTQLLEAMVQSGVKNLINTGTYWQHFDGPEYNPVALYAATKEAFENIVKYYVEAYALNAITLKLYDTYGPNDSRNKIINLLYDTYKNNSILETSPGYQLLDLVYIDDIIEAFICAEILLNDEKKGSQKTYFVTSQQLITLRDVVKTFEDIIGEKLNLQWGKRNYRNREVLRPWNDGEILPNWEIKKNLSQGLKKLIEINEKIN